MSYIYSKFRHCTLYLIS
uniref:Uncharacterized protein n=1 Tax=Rhizophora mucronata TaxID=61149 RepID=A0A2P2PYU6_RHIMU